VIIYLLALLGAGLSTLGDVCGTESARGSHPRLYDVLGTLAWAGCYPVWRAMSARSGGSFAQPAATWTIVGAVLALSVALFYREAESTLSKILFAVILCAGALRALVK